MKTRDADGFTALIRAAGYAHYKCVELLIKAGADVNTRTKEGLTALMSAVWNDHSQCQEKMTNVGLVYDCEGHSHEKCVDMLIKEGADVNSRHQNGSSAVLASVENNYYECVRFLIKTGADVNELYS